MGIFTVDTTAFKADMHELLDKLGSMTTPTELRMRVGELVDRHKMALNVEAYSLQLHKLLLLGRPERTKKLVDCFAEREYTLIGALVVALGKSFGIWVLKVAAVTAYMTLVWWACERWLAP
jgi:hypothetical protein